MCVGPFPGVNIVYTYKIYACRSEIIYTNIIVEWWNNISASVVLIFVWYSLLFFFFKSFTNLLSNKTVIFFSLYSCITNYISRCIKTFKSNNRFYCISILRRDFNVLYLKTYCTNFVFSIYVIRKTVSHLRPVFLRNPKVPRGICGRNKSKYIDQ